MCIIHRISNNSIGLIDCAKRAGDIDQWTENYLQATYPSLEASYELTIGNASASSWTSAEAGNAPIMAGGEWLTKPYSSNFVDTMLDNFDKIVTWKMIKYGLYRFWGQCHHADETTATSGTHRTHLSSTFRTDR